MKCPSCGHDNFPVRSGNSRWCEDGKYQLRYRKCPQCGYIEKTIEKINGPDDLVEDDPAECELKNLN